MHKVSDISMNARIIKNAKMDIKMKLKTIIYKYINENSCCCIMS